MINKKYLEMKNIITMFNTFKDIINEILDKNFNIKGSNIDNLINHLMNNIHFESKRKLILEME